MQLLARLAMRTRFEIALPDGGDPAQARAAGEEALDEIERAESLLSAFRADADLFRINARAALEPVPVDARLLALLAQARELTAATDGAFDMAAGALLECWNLRSMGADTVGEVPSEAAIAAALAASGMPHVVLDHAHGSVRFARSGVRLDPGAIGKGHALDRAAAVLREHGIVRALLHGGTSTVCAIGAEPGADAWKIAVRHPQDADSLVATAALRDTSLSVSAVHGKSFRADGRRFGHVIDPRSGWPVQGTLLAAVIHPSALVSDALSTALLVLGREGLAGLAKRYREAAFLVVSEDGGPGTSVTVAGTGFSR